MDEVKQETKKNKKHYDRITLLNSNINTVENLITQVREEFPSLSDIQIKDMVNFLIEIRGNELSKTELMQIYKQLFDPIKIMKLATQDLIEAKKNGVILSLQEALKKYETPSVTKNQAQELGIKRKKKAETSGELNSDKDVTLSKAENDNTYLNVESVKSLKVSRNQHSEPVFEEKNQVEKDQI